MRLTKSRGALWNFLGGMVLFIFLKQTRGASIQIFQEDSDSDFLQQFFESESLSTDNNNIHETKQTVENGDLTEIKPGDTSSLPGEDNSSEDSQADVITSDSNAQKEITTSRGLSEKGYRGKTRKVTPLTRGTAGPKPKSSPATAKKDKDITPKLLIASHDQQSRDVNTNKEEESDVQTSRLPYHIPLPYAGRNSNFDLSSRTKSLETLLANSRIKATRRKPVLDSIVYSKIRVKRDKDDDDDDDDSDEDDKKDCDKNKVTTAKPEETVENEESNFPGNLLLQQAAALGKLTSALEKVVGELSFLRQKFSLRLIKITDPQDFNQMPNVLKDFNVTEKSPMFIIVGGVKNSESSPEDELPGHGETTPTPITTDNPEVPTTSQPEDVESSSIKPVPELPEEFPTTETPAVETPTSKLPPVLPVTSPIEKPVIEISTTTEKHLIPSTSTEMPVTEILTTTEKHLIPSSSTENPVTESLTTTEKHLLPSSSTENPVTESLTTTEKHLLPSSSTENPVTESLTTTEKHLLPSSSTENPVTESLTTTEKHLLPSSSTENPVPEISTTTTEMHLIPSSSTEKPQTDISPTAKPGLPTLSTKKPVIEIPPTERSSFTEPDQPAVESLQTVALVSETPTTTLKPKLLSNDSGIHAKSNAASLSHSNEENQVTMIRHKRSNEHTGIITDDAESLSSGQIDNDSTPSGELKLVEIHPDKAVITSTRDDVARPVNENTRDIPPVTHISINENEAVMESPGAIITSTLPKTNTAGSIGESQSQPVENIPVDTLAHEVHELHKGASSNEQSIDQSQKKLSDVSLGINEHNIEKSKESSDVLSITSNKESFDERIRTPLQKNEKETVESQGFSPGTAVSISDTREKSNEAHSDLKVDNAQVLIKDQQFFIPQPLDKSIDWDLPLSGTDLEKLTEGQNVNEEKDSELETTGKVLHLAALGTTESLADKKSDAEHENIKRKLLPSTIIMPIVQAKVDAKNSDEKISVDLEGKLKSVDFSIVDDVEGKALKLKAQEEASPAASINLDLGKTEILQINSGVNTESEDLSSQNTELEKDIKDGSSVLVSGESSEEKGSYSSPNAEIKIAHSSPDVVVKSLTAALNHVESEKSSSIEPLTSQGENISGTIILSSGDDISKGIGGKESTSTTMDLSHSDNENTMTKESAMHLIQDVEPAKVLTTGNERESKDSVGSQLNAAMDSFDTIKDHTGRNKETDFSNGHVESVTKEKQNIKHDNVDSVSDSLEKPVIGQTKNGEFNSELVGKASQAATSVSVDPMDVNENEKTIHDTKESHIGLKNPEITGIPDKLAGIKPEKNGKQASETLKISIANDLTSVTKPDDLNKDVLTELLVATEEKTPLELANDVSTLNQSNRKMNEGRNKNIDVGPVIELVKEAPPVLFANSEKVEDTREVPTDTEVSSAEIGPALSLVQPDRVELFANAHKTKKEIKTETLSTEGEKGSTSRETEKMKIPLNSVETVKIPGVVLTNDERSEKINLDTKSVQIEESQNATSDKNIVSDEKQFNSESNIAAQIDGKKESSMADVNSIAKESNPKDTSKITAELMKKPQDSIESRVAGTSNTLQKEAGLDVESLLGQSDRNVPTTTTHNKGSGKESEISPDSDNIDLSENSDTIVSQSVGVSADVSIARESSVSATEAHEDQLLINKEKKVETDNLSANPESIKEPSLLSASAPVAVSGKRPEESLVDSVDINNFEKGTDVEKEIANPQSQTVNDAHLNIETNSGESQEKVQVLHSENAKDVVSDKTSEKNKEKIPTLLTKNTENVGNTNVPVSLGSSTNLQGQLENDGDEASKDGQKELSTAKVQTALSGSSEVTIEDEEKITGAAQLLEDAQKANGEKVESSPDTNKKPLVDIKAQGGANLNLQSSSDMSEKPNGLISPAKAPHENSQSETAVPDIENLSHKIFKPTDPQFSLYQKESMLNKKHAALLFESPEGYQDPNPGKVIIETPTNTNTNSFNVARPVWAETYIKSVLSEVERKRLLGSYIPLPLFNSNFNSNGGNAD